MKIGKSEVEFDQNILIICAVIALTVMLMFNLVPKDNIELFKMGYIALIGWGAGYASRGKPSATPTESVDVSTPEGLQKAVKKYFNPQT